MYYLYNLGMDKQTSCLIVVKTLTQTLDTRWKKKKQKNVRACDLAKRVYGD